MGAQNSIVLWYYYNFPQNLSSFNNPNQYIVIEAYYNCQETSQSIVAASLLSFPDPTNLDISTAQILNLAQPCPNAPVSILPNINVSWNGTFNLPSALSVYINSKTLQPFTYKSSQGPCESFTGILTKQMQPCPHLKAEKFYIKKSNILLIVLLSILIIVLLLLFLLKYIFIYE